MRFWVSDSAEVIFVCLQRRSALESPGEPMLPEGVDWEMTPIDSTGWSRCTQQTSVATYDIYAYKSRVFVRTQLNIEASSLTGLLDNHVKTVLADFKANVWPLLPKVKDSVGLHYLPVVNIPRLVKNSFYEDQSPEWMGDRVSTYTHRVYDSHTRKVGYIRVSRFTVACVGLSVELLQDVFNVIYERVLYPARGEQELPTGGLIERNFASGLAEQITPVEVGIFTSRSSAKIAVAGVLLAILALPIPVILLLPYDHVVLIAGVYIAALAILGIMFIRNRE